MKILQFAIAFLFFGQSALAQKTICSRETIKSENLRDISQYIDENPTPSEIINAEGLQVNRVIKTKDNEFIKIIAQKPAKVEFTIYPNSEIKILKLMDAKCGLELEVSGKILSDGEHLYNNSCIEIHTEEAEVIPEGTTYIAETGALNNALAELNEEMGIDSYTSGTQENFSVIKGSIQVRLKKVYKKKTRIKYTKASNKKKKFFAKKTKAKHRMFAYNGKIKLNPGATLKIKRSKKLNRKVADLEVITPD